jgi:hypothetical protein
VTLAGTVAGIAIGLALLVWVVNLIRADRLYVGYGVIFVFGTLSAMVVLAVPQLLRAATRISFVLLPEPSLSAAAIVILTFLMVYVFIQISVLANRVTRLTQELAIRDTRQSGNESETERPR